MDECMEILFRRFGKEQLESKVNEFMSQDEDGDSDITFTEFISMDLKSRRATRGTTPSEGKGR
jgi:Ca2+-binding EF-hand superfamily protein